MLSEFFQSLKAHAAERLIAEVNGKQYSRDRLHEIKPEDPKLPALVEVRTLQGFADLIENELEKIGSMERDSYIIHVEDHQTVTLKAKETDVYGRRKLVIKATPVKFEQFKFGEWLEQEDFIIAVNSLFAQTPDKDYVLAIASSLTAEAASISEDNGFSQKVTIKKGLALQDTVTLKPQVELAPYRTFPECQQPISQFVFRASIEDGERCLMLTEADGGKWKVHAINEVRRFLSTLEIGVAIIA